MMKVRIFSALALLVAVAGFAQAQPVIDGTADAAYGAALSTQNTDTQFGDASYNDFIVDGGGSEIDQVFGVVANGRLYVTIAGNLEKNFNKLEIFIDSAAGGVNTIDAGALPAGVDSFSGGSFEGLNGFTFDSGFDADHYLTFTHGNERVRPDLAGEIGFWAMSAHYADLTQGTAGANVAAGMQLAYHGLPNVLRLNGMDDTLEDFPWAPEVGDFSEFLLGPALNGTLSQGDLIDQVYAYAEGGVTDDSGTGALPAEIEFVLPIDVANDPNNTYSHRNFENTIDLQMALDNSNIEGVEGGTGQTGGNPADVTTGIEFSIPLSAIGSPIGDIRLTAFINGGNHGWVANQFSGVGILSENPGANTSTYNLSDVAGDQFVTILNEGSIPGDFDGDGDVDGNDFLVWQEGFGTIYDGDDFLIWQANFPYPGGGNGSGTVPEPSSVLLVLIGGALAALASRRR